MTDLMSKPVIPVDPHLPLILGISKNAAYDAVKRGDIDVIRIGKAIRVICLSLRKQLGLANPNARYLDEA